MPRIIYQRSSGAWWKVLLGVFLGIVLGVALVVGGVAGVAAFVSTGEIITMTGGDPNAILTEEYQNKTVLDIVMDAVGGNIKIETLGDIADITPMIDTYVTNLSEQLDDLGCDLSKDEIYSWPLTELSDNLINSVKKVELIHFLSKDKVDNPDPIVEYICYRTDDSGNYVLDEEGHYIKHTLSDMLDNGSFLQNKIDTMKIGTLFTEEEINKSPQLKAIKDKTVKELSKDGAFDDLKIADFVGSDNDSKIIAALKRDEVKIGDIGEGVNNLYLDDVYDYDPAKYDQLPAVLKKLLAKNSYTALPGEEVTVNPFTIHKMEFGLDGYPVEYDYIILSDGQFKEGVEAGKETVNDLINRTDYLKITDFFDKTTITVNKNVEDEKVTWVHNYSGTYSGTPERNGNTETFDMDIIKPAEWDKICVYCCNKPAKVKELDSCIDSLLLKDVMKIKPADSLWKVRNEPVKDGDGLFTSIKKNLTLTDIMDVSEVKFLNKLDNPETITIDKIGEEINKMKLIKAFEDNIYDASGNLNKRWKYLLIEADEPWIDGAPNKSTNPFATYKCSEYTLNGTGVGDSPKGIDQLIVNMQDHMQQDPIKQLHEDGIITITNTSIFITAIPDSIKIAYPIETAGCTYYGDLSFTNFVKIMTAYLPTA